MRQEDFGRDTSSSQMDTYAGRLANAWEVAVLEQETHGEVQRCIDEIAQAYRDLSWTAEELSTFPGWRGASADAASAFYARLKDHFREDQQAMEDLNAGFHGTAQALDGAREAYEFLPPATVPQDLIAKANQAAASSWGPGVEAALPVQIDLSEFAIEPQYGEAAATEALHWERERRAKNALAEMNHRLDQARRDLGKVIEVGDDSRDWGAGSWTDSDSEGGSGSSGGSAPGGSGSSGAFGSPGVGRPGLGGGAGVAGSTTSLSRGPVSAGEQAAVQLRELSDRVVAQNPNYQADYEGWPQWGVDATKEQIGRPTSHLPGGGGQGLGLNADSAIPDGSSGANGGFGGVLGAGTPGSAGHGGTGTSGASGTSGSGLGYGTGFGPGATGYGTGTGGTSSAASAGAGSGWGGAGSYGRSGSSSSATGTGSGGVAGTTGTNAAGGSTGGTASSGGAARSTSAGSGMMPMGMMGAGGAGSTNKPKPTRANPYAEGSGWEPEPPSEEYLREQRYAYLLEHSPWAVLPTDEAMAMIEAKQAEYDAQQQAARIQAEEYARYWWGSRFPWQKGWWSRFGHLAEPRGPKPPRPPDT